MICISHLEAYNTNKINHKYLTHTFNTLNSINYISISVKFSNLSRVVCSNDAHAIEIKLILFQARQQFA